MHRRIWVNKRLIKRMEKQSPIETQHLLLLMQKSVLSRLMNDLLELLLYEQLCDQSKDLTEV